MEKIILMFFLSFVSCGSGKQDNSKNDYDSKILSAYNYVSKKYNDKIVVSNKLIDIDIVNFTEEISKKHNREMSIVLDSLIKSKGQGGHETKQYPIKELVKNANKDGSLKLFFSEPKGNYIMVEVFETEENSDYDKLTMFSSSDVYLLYFKDTEIIDKYQIKLDYN